MMVSYVIDERGNKSHLMNEEFAWWAWYQGQANARGISAASPYFSAEEDLDNAQVYDRNLIWT